MRTAGLIVAAAIAFTMPSASAQTKSKAPDLTGETYKRHVCDCRRISGNSAKTFPLCMERRLNYRVELATAAGVVCPETGKNKK